MGVLDHQGAPHPPEKHPGGLAFGFATNCPFVGGTAGARWRLKVHSPLDDPNQPFALLFV